MSVAINVKRTKVFANTAARVTAKPDFAGQVGIQLDNLSIWQATSLTVGAWSGNFGVSSVFTVPTDGTGYVGLVAQSSPVSEPSSGVRLFGTGTGFGFIDIDAHRAVFDMAAQLTSDRTYELPNSSGTILLSGDLTGNVSLATTSGTTVTIGGGASASTLRLLEPSGSGANYTEFRAQAQAANITYILPATIGSTGQVLSTTVSGTTGTLSWITPANGDVTLAGDNAFTGTNTMSGVEVPLSITTAETNDVTVSATFGTSQTINFSASNSATNDGSFFAVGDTSVFISSAPGGSEQGVLVGASGIVLGKIAGGDPTVVVSLTGGTSAAQLRFMEPSGSGSNYSMFKAQAQAATINYTLPAALPTTNEVLAATSVSGSDVTLEWVAGGSGSGTKTVAVFTPLDNQPPASANATLDTRNSIALLAFDDGSAVANETAIFVGVMVEAANLASGLSVFVTCTAVATSGDYRLGAAWMRCNTDIDSDSFDTAIEVTTTTNGTSGVPTKTTLTTTNIDGITAGDMYRLMIYRDTGDAGDTMTGDLQLLSVEVQTAA